jgi:hypothetical protein
MNATRSTREKRFALRYRHRLTPEGRLAATQPFGIQQVGLR